MVKTVRIVLRKCYLQIKATTNRQIECLLDTIKANQKDLNISLVRKCFRINKFNLSSNNSQ